MVSTRHHPKPFPEPATPTSTTSQNDNTSIPASPSSSPTKRKSTTTLAATETKELLSPNNITSNQVSKKSRPKSSSSKTTNISSYTHTLSPIILLWLFVSLPLVFWDTSYVALRPHSMPGGKFHNPIWSLYGLYGTVDYMYGWPAWDRKVGFTAAQGSLNALETAMYVYYLAIVYLGAGQEGANIFWKSIVDGTQAITSGKQKAYHKVKDRRTAGAVVVCFASAVMTVSKTVLYWLNEYFSDFDNIGHNNLSNLIFLWIIPNGLWLVLPSYMIYILGKELIQALEVAGKPKDD